MTEQSKQVCSLLQAAQKDWNPPTLPQKAADMPQGDMPGDAVHISEAHRTKADSNQPRVTLFVDGKEFAAQDGDKIFKFTVPISGEHTIEARSGACSDTIAIRKVDKPNPAYVKAGGEVVNWFDRADEIVKEGYFSIKDSMGDVKAHPQASAVLNELIAPLQAKAAAAYGDVAKNIQIPESMQRMMDKMSVEATLKQMGKLVTPAFVHELNAALNQVKKEG